MTPSNFLKNFRNFLAGPTKRTQPCEAYNYASLLVLTTCWCLQHVPNGRHSKSFKWNTAGPFTPHTQTQMHGARRSAATSGVCLIRSGAAGFPKKLHSQKMPPRAARRAAFEHEPCPWREPLPARAGCQQSSARDDPVCCTAARRRSTGNTPAQHPLGANTPFSTP